MATIAIAAPGARRSKAARHARRARAFVAAALTVPIIYSLALPFVVLDVWIMAYEAICFPVYGIARVPRRRFFAIDRYRLPYLNAIERVHCTYCSYANGVIAYTREVAARTEAYWCPIKHRRRVASAHRLYRKFSEYGDADGYRRGVTKAIRRLEEPTRRKPPQP